MFTPAQYARLRQLFATVADNETLSDTVDELIAALAEGVVPGEVRMFAMDEAPAGWLECNGAEVSRTTYADLFSAVGTTWGVGDGTTTFNLPDLRAEFPRGWDHGKGVDSGRTFASAQAGAIANHSHEIPVVGGAAGADGNIIATSSSYWDVSMKAHPSATYGPETRPRNVALLFAIKT